MFVDSKLIKETGKVVPTANVVCISSYILYLLKLNKFGDRYY